MLPENQFNSGEYTWISLKGDYVIIGLNKNILEYGEELYSIDLPEVGELLEEENYFLTVETAKGIIEVFAPISGQVVEVNDEIYACIETLNINPYKIGLVVVELDEDWEAK